MPSSTVTLLFAFFVAASVLVKLWLDTRQARHVARHRDAVPPAFADEVPLRSHQRAADYTLDKLRFGLVNTAVSTAVLLGWTLLGGLDALNQLTLSLMGPGMGQQVALVVSFALIGGLLGLPLSWYQTFGIEQRFGFNNTKPSLWGSDLFKGLLVGALLGLPILWLVLWLMQAGGSIWWLWAWGALAVKWLAGPPMAWI